jgi:hypothetical protein
MLGLLPFEMFVFIPKTGAASSSETLIAIYRTTQHHTQEVCSSSSFIICRYKLIRNQMLLGGEMKTNELGEACDTHGSDKKLNIICPNITKLYAPLSTVSHEKLAVCQQAIRSPCLLRNPEVFCSVHNSSKLVLILSQLNSISTFKSCFFKTHFNTIIPY